MKYNAPFGVADPEASYDDGNRNAGIKGSVPPAAAVEAPQRELVHLINFAGLTPSKADLQQVRKAIEALISAATGGGETSQFLLVDQARARLPIFPEILSADGRMNVSSPAAGTVQVPTSVEFQHRGIFPLSTSDFDEADRTFETLAGKTYHLRWTPANGFALKELADASYNPSVLPEGHPDFDSSYDDMLVARIVTDASNVATITNLANLHRLIAAQTHEGPATANQNDNTANATFNGALDWARTPILMPARSKATSDGGVEGSDNDFNLRISSLTRYGYAIYINRDYTTELGVRVLAQA